MSRGSPVRHRSRMLRASLAIALVASAAATVLTGCATGDGLAPAFAHEFSDDPAVAEVDVTTIDGMPFTGGVSGTVRTTADLDDGTITALVQHVRAFAAEAGADRVRIEIHTDGWSFPALLDADAGARVLDRLRALRADPRLLSGTLSAGESGSVEHLALVTTDPDATISTWREGVGDEGWLPAHLAIADEQGILAIDGPPGDWADPALQVRARLEGEVALRAVEIERSSIRVRVGDEADVQRAQEIVDAAADRSMTVSVASDLVLLAPGARGDAVRDLLAALPPPDADVVQDVWTDDVAARFTIRGRGALLPLARSLGAAAPAAGFERIGLRHIASDDSAVNLTYPPVELAERASAASRVVSAGTFLSFEASSATGIRLEVDRRVKDAALAAFAPALRDLARTGERVCVERDEEAAFCFVAESTISTSGGSDWGRAHASAFVAAWNSAARD
ncbi:hypothetical protein ACFWHT_02680 [Microbacterium sp. NPDC058342]|uniref:hypothetical protein n=1 Tax=Microbacterium sp. NPDC058342 TaxID=3346454 RepID=UPI003667D679